MVSAGGAGSAYYRDCGGFIQGGHGGDLNGSDETICTNVEGHSISQAIGAKQNLYGIGASSYGINGSFGIGGYCGHNSHGSGGSGGYYGGGSGGAVYSRVASGSGGSSYISGHENCKAISKDYNETNMKHLDTSVHFSGFKFYSTTLLNGNSRIPGFTSNTFENGHNGYGQARITVLETMNPISKCFCSYIKFSYILLFTNIELSEEE
ncbi:loricrin, putative [Trichomonas vaginalis G3]|uniref:receptor protein-tyrosine kinase n=1 Tax=Trichomonas vaginalis (strain ATCC PRA-98 / G3) TaxID=412133 RepID=A2EPM1_TRIV3|nr:glycine-rich protein family [Trichomonas vaginalis G3]EAY05364.1 loricrin, putative [Trichomonas vaginalis G3]KAI5524047.1 glycine-rich protein family [Trichomonas vaginalis G3]|eukprot:XP_001317587.1 loricrin [Trichomonas vaginalis G3]